MILFISTWIKLRNWLRMRESPTKAKWVFFVTIGLFSLMASRQDTNCLVVYHFISLILIDRFGWIIMEQDDWFSHIVYSRRSKTTSDFIDTSCSVLISVEKIKSIKILMVAHCGKQWITCKRWIDQTKDKQAYKWNSNVSSYKNHWIVRTILY